MKNLITMMAVTSALLSTSCSDELNSNDYSVNNKIQAIDDDITNGINVFICSQDTISNAHLALAANTQVTAVADNSLVSMNLVRDMEGNAYLQPSLSSAQDTVVTTRVMINVPENTDKNKSIIVSIRPASNHLLCAASKDSVHDRLTDIFTYGVYGNLLPGDLNVEHPAFDANAIKKYVENHQNFRMDARTFQSYGTSIKEVTEKWNISTNWQVPGKVPFIKWKMCDILKINFNMNSSSSETHEREYLIVDGQDYKAFGLLSDTIASSESNSDLWISLLDPRLNDLLHNPKKYEKSYPLTEQGTMNLIAAFGSHIPTQALLGSGVRFETSKTIDIVDNSFGMGVSLIGENYANLGGYTPEQAGGITQQNARAFIARALLINATGGQFVAQSGNISYDKSKKDYSANTDQKKELVTIGNGSFDGDRWVAGASPSDWQTLAYCCPGKTLREPRMIALYELISKKVMDVDPDVKTRYELLKKAIDIPENAEYPPYLTYFNYITPEESVANYVICDFVVKTEDEVNPQPFAGKVKCKDGKYHEVMYYPMRWSNEAGNVGESEWKYTAFDTRADAFLLLAQTKHQHFYYAIIQSSLHDGIDGITFVPEDSDESILPWVKNKNRGNDYTQAGWTRRSYDGTTCSDVVCGADCDNVVPYVHYRNEYSKSKPISAVCIFEDVETAVLASSAGTEFEEKNAQYTDNYKAFWKKCSKLDANTTIGEVDTESHWYRFTDRGSNLDQTKYYSTNSACAYGWFRAASLVRQPHHIYVGYSFKNLPTVLETPDGYTPLVALTPAARK